MYLHIGVEYHDKIYLTVSQALIKHENPTLTPPRKAKFIKNGSDRINNSQGHILFIVIAISLRNREYLHERALRSKSFKAKRNCVILKIREAKRALVEEAIDQRINPLKDMLSRIKQFLTSKRISSSCSQLQTESGTTTSFESMANNLNDFL